MSAQDNKQLVIQGYRLFHTGDIRGLLELYHEDAQWVGPESEFMPFTGNFHGRQGIAQFFSKLTDAAHPLQFEPQQFIAEGDQVVVVGEASWIAKATGRSYENRWVHVFTLRDNKVARIELIYDTAPGDRAFNPVQPGSAANQARLHH